MKKLIFLATFVIAVTSLTFADEARMRTEFYSSDSAYILEYDMKKNWILKDKQGQLIATIKDENFTSMTIHISNDGCSIVVIDDYAEGHVMKHRSALWIFHKGELMKKHKFSELLDDTCNVALSEWHIDWLVNDHSFDEKQHMFEFATNEFYNYAVDLKSGEFIRKKRPEGFDDRTHIVQGTFRQQKGSDVVMKISRYIAGDKLPGNKIGFRTAFFPNGTWTTAVMIKDGRDITPKKFRNEVKISRCLIDLK